MTKRALSLFLALILCLGLAVPALAAGEVVQSGYCGGEGDGTNLSWTLTDDGTLTISGTGPMKDYCGDRYDNSYDPTPWEKHGQKIVTVVIQEGVTTIGDYAFWGCYALTDVTFLEGLTTIGESAFASCTALINVTFPEGLTTIGDLAFSSCTALTNVTFPEGLTTIGESAFASCTALTNVTFPEGLTTIGGNAFYWCSALTDVTFQKGLTTIGDDAFSRCTALTHMTLREGLTTIGDRAFENCDALTGVTFPEGLTTIGSEAFESCDSLVSVAIPTSVTTIGVRAFGTCPVLTSFVVSENNPAYTAVDGVLFNKDKTTLIQYFKGNSSTTYTVPGGVTTIGDYAFWDCHTLTDVTLPASVTTIGDWAFTSGSAEHNEISVRFFGDVPQAGNDSHGGPFNSHILTAYYPEGNSTWTEEAKKQVARGAYDVTWIPFDVSAFQPATYTVTVAAAQHGKVTASPAKGAAGTKVTLTVTPDNGYELDTLTVKQASGTAVKVTDNTFTMPASNVTVTATFKELSSEEPGKGEMRQSGGKGIAKLTREEIVALLNENPSDTPKDVFVTAPNCTAPYEIGEVKWEVLERVTNRLNALRTLAGLPKVTLDKQLCEDAQYGAVILGKLGYLSHYPDQPEDMDQAFYQRASAATSSSNIYAGMSLCATPDGFMDDSDASNIDRVGHRRWQLNPTMGKVGFGYAETNSGYYRYTAEMAHDKSGEGCDYDFIGWPASGDFPIGAFFDANTAWSVTVNPKKYQTPSAEKITVHLTREGDGTSWTFSTLGNSDAGYFNVETSNYGVNNCVIFRPDLSGDRDLVGETYTVTIDGLKTIDGTSVDDFSYQVSFFDPKQTVTPGTDGSTGGGGESTGGSTPASQTFGDVEKGSWYESGVTFVVSKGLFNGVGDGVFAPQQNMTRAMLMTVLARLDGQSTDGGATWYSKGMDWAKAQGISDGTAPEGNITREQLVTMLYRYAKSPAVDAAMGMAGYADVAAISDWATDAMRWAVQNGILTGKGDARLDPQGLATRAEVATILQRYVEKLGQ